VSGSDLQDTEGVERFAFPFQQTNEEVGAIVAAAEARAEGILVGAASRTPRWEQEGWCGFLASDAKEGGRAKVPLGR
jgi:hypothetical protein